MPLIFKPYSSDVFVLEYNYCFVWIIHVVILDDELFKSFLFFGLRLVYNLDVVHPLRI